MRVLYTHRTQGVGAEGAHVKGMYEAFGELGHVTDMDCLPGCNPSLQAPSHSSLSSPSGTAQAPPKPSLLKKTYWLIAELAPQPVFELIEVAYNLPLFLRLSLKCLRFKPDLVYERYSLNTFAPSLVCGLLGIKHVLEVNDSVVIERSRPLSLKGMAAAVEGFSLRAADLSITITDQFRAQLENRFGLGKSKLIVLTNAVSRTRFERAFDRDKTRASLGIRSGTVLGGTGQFLPWHGLQSLVEKLGPLAAARNIHFLFIGDGPAREEVVKAAHAHGIPDRVHFTGMLPIDEVPAYLAALDIAVIPSAAPHASPMKLIEYMAMGLPVIGPDLPSIKAAITGPDLGFIFPAGDMEAMKESVLACLTDPAATCAAGANAKAYVFKHLTWRGHAEEVLKCLGLPPGKA